MGCGGSRADAIIEPRYHESWTRETESTWLTNTDVEPPVSVPNSKLDSRISRFAGQVPLESKAVEAGLKEKRMVTTGTQCGKQAITANGSNHQRRPRRSLTDGQCCEKVLFPLTYFFCVCFSVTPHQCLRLANKF
uniref:BAALC binder of MAP3K1 and KLF4 b n=1 Tax=Poecilia reticulata TaxID=8081 RepID=A0A3P9NL15_POERE